VGSKVVKFALEGIFLLITSVFLCHYLSIGATYCIINSSVTDTVLLNNTVRKDTNLGHVIGIG
jgi:hypothetical protein